MKLEGELAFFHSKMGVEPESQSFKFNNGDQNSAGVKLQNQKANEYDNRVSNNLKKNDWGKGLDSSRYDMKSADCMAKPKLEFYNSAIDFSNDHGAHVIVPKSHSSTEKRGLGQSTDDLQSTPMPKLEYYDTNVAFESDYKPQEMELVDPVPHSLKQIGSFMKFANLKQSVKMSSNLPEEIGSFQNSVDAYTDKTVMQCDPELVVCYKGNNYHVVKDICVDEGLLTKHNFLIATSVDNDDKANNFTPSESFGMRELQRNETQVSPTQANDVMHRDVTENLAGNTAKEIVLPEETRDSLPSDDEGEQLSSETGFRSQFKGSEGMVEAVLATPTLGLAADESNSDGTESFSYHIEPSSAPANCDKKELHQFGGCSCDEAPHTLKPIIEGRSYDHGETSHVRDNLGESSFSAAGAVSGRISYSGSIPYSGSISIRSDSSTTSTRSFAFPILQSEWNSSPVKMAKPERSRHQKLGCWKNGLFCCKF